MTDTYIPQFYAKDGELFVTFRLTRKDIETGDILCSIPVAFEPILFGITSCAQEVMKCLNVKQSLTKGKFKFQVGKTRKRSDMPIYINGMYFSIRVKYPSYFWHEWYDKRESELNLGARKVFDIPVWPTGNYCEFITFCLDDFEQRAMFPLVRFKIMYSLHLALKQLNTYHNTGRRQICVYG